ncbi:kinesin light chain [Xylaria palmicola]|nr:kinesin light chain [Xylaria palmicola]
MRLLARSDNTGLYSLTYYPPGTSIPPYAILSHTWGPEEVTYKDLEQGTGQHKTAYKKIRFCGEQATRHGLRHFWVDTCCIDKSSSAELTESINSMFRWYRDAAKCYAYLEDVSSSTMQDGDPHIQLKQSRWFTRGWTLQELIAPKTVDFYSREGTALGNKESLEQLICGTTGIPAQALRGCPLSHFTTSERMAWAETRKTTVPEDKAYSMLGIFETQMPLIYGEGEERALKRLREEIIKDQKGSRHEEFSVPFSLHGVPDIAHFVAREQELADMRKTLKSDGRRRVVVLHGLGGMGKTQLAIEYMKRNKDNYSAIFWLNIKDENSLKQSFARIAHQIKRQHPSASRVGGLNIQKDLDETIDAVKAWLSLPSNSRWLMVYGNYDNPKLLSNTDPAAINIQEYLPESYQGSIVITTRLSQVKIGHAIRLLKMQNLNDSLQILESASKREGLADNLDAIHLAQKLDGLPLALATAGGYLEQTSVSFRSYLCLYEDSWTRLQISSPELSSYEDRTLYSTWQLSLDQIQRQNKHSAALLQLWAYFDNQDIWLELLQSYYTHSIDWIHEITKDELSFSRTVRTLTVYGLVEVDSSVDQLIESRGYSVHGCVHSWITHVLNREWSIDLARFAIMCIASHIPDQDSSHWWLTQRRLLRHAAKYSGTILHRIIDDKANWIPCNLGNLYSNQGKLKEAEEMYQRALQGDEKALGPDHTSTLDTVNNLGNLYSDQGKLKEAEEMYKRALQGKEKALGPDHTSTLVIARNSSHSDSGNTFGMDSSVDETCISRGGTARDHVEV